MIIKLKADFSSSTSAQAIFETILEDRQLKLDPPRPQLKELIKDFGLSGDDLEQTRKIINKHLLAGHDILIYGDYDADGVTASAIMYLTLTHLAKGTKARIFPFIPDRTRHGYGLSQAALKEIFSGQAFANSAYPDFAPQLIITVDNGIVSHSEISQIKKRGVDVIVTDHHLVEKSLPPADSLLHSTVSSGAGLAWVLALFLTDESLAAYQLLELATLGVVADQLPLTGVNRQLVIHGLKLLSHSKFTGIKVLVQHSQLKSAEVSVSDINFRLAPRINAAGRLSDATDALRLLCTNDVKVANKLAQTLEKNNQARQDLTISGIEHALKNKPTHNLIVAASPDYHEGVVGLIAGRLVERYSRPALALSIGKDYAKGSARSPSGIDITKLLRHFSSEFESLGGHALAAGFTVKNSKLKSLTKKLETYADQTLSPTDLTPQYTVEGELKLAQTSRTLTELLDKLAPFGLGNPKPRFVSRDLNIIEDRRLGKEGTHRRLTLEQAGTSRQAIWFNCPHKASLTKLQDLVYSLDINHYRGKEYLQLVVKNAEI